jgi:hypothetical protein
VFPDTASLPVQRFEFATSDVDGAHEAVRETYSDHEVQLRGDVEDFAHGQLTAVAYRKAYGRYPRHTLRT